MRIIIRILLLLVVVSCSRRPLGEENARIAMVPIKIDWSKSNINVKDISRATVRIFPKNGYKAYDFVMQESIYEDVIPLPVGRYSFIIFNETTDPGDWKSLTFSGADDYNTFAATTKADIFKGLYTKVDDDIRKTPDKLAVWSIGEFEVTQEMIGYTRTIARGESTKAQFAPSDVTKIEGQMTKLTTITPLPVFKQINIVARVVNLVSSQKSSGALTNAVGTVQMATRKPIETNVTHVFVMNGRIYDKPSTPKDGTIRASIIVFDAFNVENLKSDFRLDFLLHDGTIPPSEVFDVTADVKKTQPIIDILLGFETEGRPDDRPIILPEIPITGGDVGVDDWEDVVIPME